MPNFTTFLTPVSSHFDSVEYELRQLGSQIEKNFDNEQFDFEDNYDIALIYVPEYRGAGVQVNPNGKIVRNHLYQLFSPQKKLKVADLGNIMPGSKLSDTYYAIQMMVKELMDRKTLPIIIGGSRDLSYGSYLGYQEKERAVSITSVDNSIGFGNAEKEINANNYINKILLHQPGYLFNYSNIGYQNYLVSEEVIELLEELYFDTIRLGVARKMLQNTEPIIRNADLFSFDLSAIRQSDASECLKPSPNGLSAEEACQIAHYAGMSDKLSSIGLFGLGEIKEESSQTSNLLAQIIWHFIEGYYNRKNDFPVTNLNNYTKYIVNIENSENEIVYLKSKKSERWWMDVNYSVTNNDQPRNHFYLPCTYEDYKTACKNEIPDRWFKIMQKLK